MRGFIFAAVLCCASAASAEEYVTTQPLPPCDADTDGVTLIVTRPPTAEEIALAPNSILLLERDSIVCDGTHWNFSVSMPLYRVTGG